MDKFEIVLVRTKLSLSQNHFAELVGVDPTTVARWETGKSEPSKEHKDKLMELSKMDGH